MDRLKVVNMALMKAGLPLAASMEDCDWNADYIFEDVAGRLLRVHKWGFAQKFVQLAKVGQGEGYSHAYLVPGDCINPVDVRNVPDVRAPVSRFRRVGNCIHTNANPCYFRYISNCLDPDFWLPDFADAVAAAIATEIITLSGQNMNLSGQLMQLAEVSLARAQLADARENMDRVNIEEGALAARRNRS